MCDVEGGWEAVLFAILNLINLLIMFFVKKSCIKNN